MYMYEDVIDEIISRSEKEITDYLSRYWGIVPDENGVFTVIGTYKKADHKDKNGKEFAYFEDIRNTDGDILYYPIGAFGKVKLRTACDDKLEKQDTWKISAKLASKKDREKNPFTLIIANTIFDSPSMDLKDRLTREAQIRKIFKDTGFTEQDAKNEVEALHFLMDDQYSKADDRFIYELLQNADDQPVKGQSVSVVLQLLKDHLLFMHDGRAFDEDDVAGICSIGKSTKRKDKEKIGYKGIGFKCVFTVSNTVIIKSGNYSFAFDFHSPEYGNNTNMENIPWQLKPIWQEKYRYPKEILENECFWGKRVGISLEIDKEKNDECRRSIDKIFSYPLFLLFLKNVDSLVFKEGKSHTTISKNKDDVFFKIERDEKVDSLWLKKDNEDIRIPPEISEELQYDRHAPDKLKNATLTQISFAAKVEDGEIAKLNNPVLYAYLPTTVNNFNFPFIVNADFLLTGNREQLHVDSIWNKFLFCKMGKLVVDWVASLSSVIPSYLELLPTDLLIEEEAGALSLSTFFNKSFAEAIESKAFILTEEGKPARQEEIIIDKTGLSKIVGAQLFCQLLKTEKHLPSEKINCKILEANLFKLIETLKFDPAIEAITNNSDFNKWFISSSEEQKKKLYDWIKNNSKTHGDKIKTFVINLPLFQFGENHKSNVEIGVTNQLITTNHIVPIEEILTKLGYVCSDTVFDEKHPLYEFIDLRSEENLFNSIKECDYSKLDAAERKTLFLSLKNFNGIGDAKFGEISLFRNMEGNPKPLGEMVVYRENSPIWLSEYMICKEDFDADLSDYLIAQECELKSIIQEHLVDIVHYGEIGVSFADLYNTYKWDGEFTRQIIDDGWIIDYDLLTIIEDSDKETIKHFLNHIQKVVLSSSTTYKKDSYEYRVLKLALSKLDNPSDFSSKIFFNGQCINHFSVSDDVICKYTQNGENKSVKLSLSKLLPDYQNKSTAIEKIIGLFEIKKDLDKFFIAKPKPIDDILDELNILYNVVQEYRLPRIDKYGRIIVDWKRNPIFRKVKHYKWNNQISAYQYIFYLLNTHQVDSNILKIKLEEKNEDFIRELMDTLYDQKVNIQNASFTWHIKGYLSGKYVHSPYTTDSERIIPTIEKWANDEEKQNYLEDNGVQTYNSRSIQFRQLFLENKPINFIGILSDNELSSGIAFIANAGGFERPFTGNNQKTVLLKLKDKICCHLSDSWDEQKMEEESEKWDTKEYRDWISEHHTHIFIYPGLLPSKLSYKNVLLLNYQDVKDDYCYVSKTQKLFVSNRRRTDEILFEVVKEGEAGLDIDDYKFLCWGDDKITILESKDKQITSLLKDNQEKDKQIFSLMKDNQEKDELLKRYRAKLSNNDDDVEDNSDVIDTIGVSIKKGENISISKNKQYDAQIEAQRFLMNVMENWSFPEGYGEADEFGKPKHYSTIMVKDENGDSIPIVLKSYKKTSNPFKINTQEWDWIIQDSAKLLIYDGRDVKIHDPKDLIRNQANVSITFSTENLDIEERISAFSDSLHYFKELHFDFGSFNISKKAKSVRDIYTTNIGVQNNISDEEAL